MPNVAPACASYALVALDSKQPKAFSLVTFDRRKSRGTLSLWTKKVTRRFMAEAFGV
jgi:hypothetical protein